MQSRADPRLAALLLRWVQAQEEDGQSSSPYPDTVYLWQVIQCLRGAPGDFQFEVERWHAQRELPL